MSALSDFIDWDNDKIAAWWWSDTSSVGEFEMGYNPNTKRYEKGYRLPDGSNFSAKTTTWKNFLTPEDLARDFWFAPLGNLWHDRNDNSKTLTEEEFLAIKNRRGTIVSAETPLVTKMNPTECHCDKPSTTGPKGAWECPRCDQTWLQNKQDRTWKRIPRFRFDEIVGSAPKPRKPRAKKTDLAPKALA